MNKIFVKAEDLKLKNDIYVVTGENETPVSNKEFIAAQIRAEYVVTFAEACKGKDFKGKEADSIDLVRSEVTNKLADKTKKYLKVGKKPVGTIQSKLAKEALDFIKFGEKSDKVEKVNDFLQEFNIISKFEDMGLYFEEEVVELNKIYTMNEIVNAVESTIDLV